MGYQKYFLLNKVGWFVYIKEDIALVLVMSTPVSEKHSQVVVYPLIWGCLGMVHGEGCKIQLLLFARTWYRILSNQCFKPCLNI